MDLIDEPPEKAASLVSILIGVGETRRLEYKRVSGKMVGKALETVCGLANAEGGTLVLGGAAVKENKGPARIFGVEENPEAIDELQRKLLTEFVPPIRALRLRRLKCTLHNGPFKGQLGHLLLVNVLSSDRVHSIVNSGTFTSFPTAEGCAALPAKRLLWHWNGSRQRLGAALPPVVAR